MHLFVSQCLCCLLHHWYDVQCLRGSCAGPAGMPSEDFTSSQCLCHP